MIFKLLDVQKDDYTKTTDYKQSSTGGNSERELEHYTSIYLYKRQVIRFFSLSDLAKDSASDRETIINR